MSGRILIVETTTSQRIFLRGQLECAHYEVETTADLADARDRIGADSPDLMLLDISSDTQAALALCAALRESPATAMLPVIALACQPNTELRLAALQAGADDILDKRGDAGFLLARIRSLLRVRDASAEIGLDGHTRRALGMAEATGGFVPAGRTAILSGRPAALPQPVAALAGRLPGGALIVDPDNDPAGGWPGTEGAPPDLFVIDHGGIAAAGSEAAALFRLIADLQARRATRLARTLVVIPDGAQSLAEMALDLGADDLVTESVAAEELAFRVRTQLRRKSQSDRMRDRLQTGLEAAVTDPLTGLHNRRYAMAELAGLVERTTAAGTDFAVMILDIDHFKRINDSHGHAAGDAVLCEVARRLRANLRAVDLVARIGGEEFLVAMPDTPVERARCAADRLRKVIEDAPFDIAGDGLRLRVTLSAGVAVGRGPETASDPVAAIFDRADRALYAAKSAGRNTVTIARPAA